MKVLYLPVFRAGVAYTVSYGRRWSVLEHLLLHDLCTSQASVAELSARAELPERLIVEALINLLRAGWVEVRTADDVALFSCTALGRKRAAEPRLKAELKRRIRWLSLCMDRVTGSWIPADGLDLVHERDLPPDAETMAVEVNTLDPQNGDVRELLELANDEVFERLEPYTRAPARLFARVTLSLGALTGIPAEAPMRLRSALLEHQTHESPGGVEEEASHPEVKPILMHENITQDNFLMGGPAHKDYLQRVLNTARSHVIIHSCFLHPDALRALLPDVEAAALRKVRIDLLWGLVADEEDLTTRWSVTQSHKVLETLSPKARARVVLSATSSSSHLKVILSDSGPNGAWETLIGSCNFLSSWFNLLEMSVRVQHRAVAARVLGHLVDAQLPASGGWSPLVMRLNELWSSLKRRLGAVPTGTHSIELLFDQDHYACIRRARDSAASDIVIGCDLFGQAAETSAVVPMERAAELGKRVGLLYRRSSKSLSERGVLPDSEAFARRGLKLKKVENLHGKFMLWGEEAVAISSFNWLATAVGARARGAEMGLLIEGPNLRSAFVEAVAKADLCVGEILEEHYADQQPQLFA